ncbi:MAG: hypothetical protein DYG94_05840 [Leptolyngbya sp. PLA3]|nr:MAG: hypothetical protein EDM82_03730 [Cyanobacteria bacterium CYA]MCE7968252.1 hypothetical protein [Leptolyngbya sp. PL-A3]
MWVLGALLVCAIGGRAWAQATLPPGIQEAPTLSSQQQADLEAFIQAQVETMRTGSTLRARSQARDQLLAMFDRPSVSTAFRFATGSALSDPIAQLIESEEGFLRYAGYRLAARTATEASARVFERGVATSNKSDQFIALGQVRVLFLEADRGGLAMQSSTLERLAGTIGRLLAEETDPHVALYQVRALRALSAIRRAELSPAARRGLMELSRGVSERLQSIPARSFGQSDEDLTHLLVFMESMDAVRSSLATLAGPLNGDLAAEMAHLAGQNLALVTRVYGRVPPTAENARRHLERLVERSMESTKQIFAAMQVPNPPPLPDPATLVRSLSGGNMNNFRIEVIKLIGENGLLYRQFNFKPDTFQLD